MSNGEHIWIDLDNTPHVPFFRPIIRELEARGHTVSVSARQAFQVCELADLFAMRYEKIGRHYGKRSFLKVWGVVSRALQLVPFVLRNKPRFAISHGSRSQILLCNILRIPTVMVMDYEHAKTPGLLRPRWQIVPSALSREQLQCRRQSRILTYPGIKEDVYAPDFVPDGSLPATLGLDPRRIVVTVRPPATEATAMLSATGRMRRPRKRITTARIAMISSSGSWTRHAPMTTSRSSSCRGTRRRKSTCAGGGPNGSADGRS